MPAKILLPPSPLSGLKHPSVFLAGSIEQGTADNWQDRLIDALKDLNSITILNPRRKDWNPDLKQDMWTSARSSSH